MDKINKYLAATLISLFTLLLTIIVVGKIQDKFRSNESPETVFINSTLAPFINEYMDRLESEGIDLTWGKDLVSIDFSVSLPNNILGVAWGMDIDNITVISINGRVWNYLTHQQKRLLVFHELTHDVFNVRHFETGLMNTPMPFFVSEDKVDSLMDDLVAYLKINEK